MKTASSELSAASAFAVRTGERGALTRLLPGLRQYGPLVAACFLLAWGVSFGWWLLLPGARTVELVVPAGTAEAVASGSASPALPNRLELRRGDTLAIRNQDTAVHRVGTTAVPVGHTVRIPVTPALLGAAGLACSFHPSGSIGVSPLARPGIQHTIIPTLLAGVPLAGALVLSVAVARRLGDGQP